MDTEKEKQAKENAEYLLDNWQNVVAEDLKNTEDDGVRTYEFTPDEEKLIATALYFYQESGYADLGAELDLIYELLAKFDEYVDAGKGYSWENQ